MYTRFNATQDNVFPHTFNLTGCMCVQCAKNNTLMKNMKNIHMHTHRYNYIYTACT